MKTFFTKISHAGLSGLDDPLNYRRVLFVNNLSLVTSIISLLVALLIAVEGLFPQVYVILASSFLFILVVYFNNLKRYVLARSYFIVIAVSSLSIASIIAYEQNRFNEVEDILIGFMAVAYLLFDGRMRYVGFLIIYAVLISLKVMKQGYQEAPFDFSFFISIQNVSILSLLIYLFADAFRKSLLRSYVRLKEKDELLYSMIDSVPLFIGLVDKELRYRMVNLNYETSFEIAREKIIGSHIRDVLPSDILENHTPMIERTLQGESPEFLEYTELPNGTSFYAGGKYTPVRSDDGEVIGAAVFVNDVTKREIAKNKLKTANATKDKLFSIVAHDIRGPLDLFDGLLDVSDHINMSPEEFRKHQEKIRQKLSGLRETVNTLLEWARTQLDGVNSLPDSTEIDEIVVSNLELYHELIGKKKIVIDKDIEPGLSAWVDANHLKVGVRNILHNSLKFTPEGGSVSLRGYKENGQVVLSIKDTGIGMSERRIESVLNKEIQASKSGTEGEMGTGLGLSLSLELLEKNECEVAIESEVGMGTKITIKMKPVNEKSPTTE